MKKFHVNYNYRGRYFDIVFCNKTAKEAAERIGYSYYYLITYSGSGRKIEQITKH